MRRYIDADELLKRLPDDLPYKGSVKRVLIQAPGVDAVEVVRCNCCGYYDRRKKVCNRPTEPLVSRKPNDFCSYGVRCKVITNNENKSNNSAVMSNKQIEEMKITKIYEPIDITDEMRHLADEMGKAISTEYEKRVLADERKLEAVLRENGWRKASELAKEIFAELGKLTCTNEEDYRIFAELKKKYTEVEE